MPTQKKLTRAEYGSLADPQLVAAFRRGEELAFAELVKRYEYTLQDQAFRTVHNRELAEDAVQIAFFEAAKYIRAKKSEVYNFRSWIGTIVNNRARDMVRGRAYQRILFFSEVLRPERERAFEISDPRTPPDEACHTSLVVEQAVRAIESLPAKERQAIELGDLADWHTDDVAKVMGTTPDTVRCYRNRGHIKLRKRLATLRA